MLRPYFEQYISVTRGKSARHYITGINSINTLLKKYKHPVCNLFAVTTIEELNSVKDFLDTNVEFLEKDSTGHHMYSVAFNHFYRFVCEDSKFFGEKIADMDIIVAKPKTVTTSATQWRRNQIIISQAIDGADHRCECDSDHQTFIARSSGKAYMEGHHLIPMRYQAHFDCGIDVYANVVCLCPICHRLLHFGREPERSYAAEQLFDLRKDRLIKSGIDLSKKDFLELVFK